MSAQASARQTERAISFAAALVAVAGGSAFLGVALVYIAVGFGGDAAPLVLVAIPGVLLAAAIMLQDPRFGVALVFASFPLGFAAVQVGPFRLQATEIVIAAAVLLVGFLRLGNGRVPLIWPSRLFWALALIVWAVTVSFPTAIEQGPAVKQLLTLLAGVVFVALIVTVCPDLAAVRVLLGVLVAVALVISLGALLGTGPTHVFYAGAVVEGRAQGLFIEPNELGSFASMAALAAIGLALGARTAVTRLLTCGALAVILGALVLSLSRGAWLGTLTGIGLLLLTVTQARRAVLILAVPVLLTIALLNVFLPAHPQVQVVGERARVLTKLDQPYEGRPAIWSEALRQARAEPITGEGPGNFGVASRRLASSGQTVYTGHAHNLYLNVAAELGFVALGFLLLFFVAIGAAVHRSLTTLRAESRFQDRAVVAGLAAALFSFAVQGLTNTFIGNPIIDATAWGLVGFVLVAFRETDPRPVVR